VWRLIRTFESGRRGEKGGKENQEDVRLPLEATGFERKRERKKGAGEKAHFAPMTEYCQNHLGIFHARREK